MTKGNKRLFRIFSKDNDIDAIFKTQFFLSSTMIVYIFIVENFSRNIPIRNAEISALFYHNVSSDKVAKCIRMHMHMDIHSNVRSY